VHSLHAYFLLGGKPGVPIDYHIERVRDGRSFTTRVVKAVQDTAVIFDMSASFHKLEDGPTYQLPLPDVPGPDSDVTYDPGFGRWVRRRLPFEFRELGPTEPVDGVWRSTRRVWMRTVGRLPDDPAVHACLLAFVSDMGMVFAARAPFEDSGWERIMGASLDHAMWFHRPIRLDDWVYYDQWAIANAGARGLAQGTMHAQDGTLGVTIAQEALLRFVRPDRVQAAGPGDDEPRAEA
jgi:acyl-CoA thioesterase-2